METSGDAKRKRDQGKKDRIVIWKANIKGKDVAPIAGILFHDDREEDEDGLDVDECLELIHTIDETTERGDTEFTGLCRAGNVPMASLMVEFFEKNDRLATVDTPTGGGASALNVSCYVGNIEIAKLLAEKGADINKARSSDGATPLHFACLMGHGEVVELLLAKGADVDKAMTNGTTPLSIACQYGHDTVVKLLLANGAGANSPAFNGNRSIYSACKYGHEKCLEILLAYNADVSPHNGWCPLAVANFNGHLGCVRIIREWPVTSTQIAVKLCVGALQRQGMYDVVNAVPTNELSKAMFAFKVLEEMKSRQMHGLADLVVSYVGINN